MRKLPQPRPGTLDVQGIIQAFAQRLMYSVAHDQHTARDFDVYQALARAVRDRLMERWFKTQNTYYRQDVKRTYYLSLEFLMGRSLVHNILNLGAQDAYARAMAEMGLRLEDVAEQEWDAGLGNGGLGRLAACILDAAATLELPFYGYGIRYEYGIFLQKVADGGQVEYPDGWLRYGNPWEIQRPDAIFPVRFYGRTQGRHDPDGRYRVDWLDTQDVWAMAYDTPVAGFRNGTVNTLRLWAAKSSREFDLASFNSGEYIQAVQDKTQSENISKVLYPADDRSAGQELRLKQQYFFVSATLQDVVRRFKKRPSWRWEELPDKVAVQLNDTHPSLAVPELMRVLVDQEGLDWDPAWALTQKVCAYTNHTILPEALEVWPVDLWRRLLPRHLEIVEEIDRRFRRTVRERYPFDDGKIWPAWPSSTRAAACAWRTWPSSAAIRSTAWPSCTRTSSGRPPSPSWTSSFPGASTTRPTASPRGAGCSSATRGWRRWSARPSAKAGPATWTSCAGSPRWPGTPASRRPGPG